MPDIMSSDGVRWEKAIPIPFFGPMRKRCHCGKKFFKMKNYHKHYRNSHF